VSKKDRDIFALSISYSRFNLRFFFVFALQGSPEKPEENGMGTAIGRQEFMIQHAVYCESGSDPRTISDGEVDDDGKPRRTGIPSLYVSLLNQLQFLNFTIFMWSCGHAWLL
jgi:hypothetical protein